MGISDVLAATALVVSIFSAWVSYKAHRQSTEMNERESRRGFERERSEFLVRIEKSRKLFERAQSRINALLAQIDRQPEAVKMSLKREISQLKDDERYLQGCIRQSWALWDETYETSQDGIAHHKPRHLGLIEDDEVFAESALQRAEEVETAMNQALAIFHPIGG